MRIEFDEPKRQRNIEKHGLDFTDFSRCFDRDSAERIDTTPSRTGRERYLLIGRWNEEVVVLAVRRLPARQRGPVSSELEAREPGREGYL